MDFRVVRSLDSCSKGPVFKTTFIHATKCEERNSQLSVVPGKKVKGITRSHREEGPGSHCSISSPIHYSVDPYSLAHKTNTLRR